MKAFTDIANAKLPVTNPDPVLLALIQSDQHLGCTERCVRDANAGACREDQVATPSPSNIKSVPASEEAAAAMLEPPMALAGPKTAESDETIPATREPAQKAIKRGNIDRPARAEGWATKLWRDSTP